MSDNHVEEQKSDLDRQKFEFEKQKYKQESRFLNKNLGIIITSIISVSAVAVSISQAYIAYHSSIETIHNERDKSDRSYSFDVAKFLMETRDDINTNDLHKLRYIRQVVIASFPKDVVSRISSRMSDITEDDKAKEIWADAYVYSNKDSAPAIQGIGHHPLTADALAKMFDVKLSGKEDRLKALLDGATEFGIKDQSDLAVFLSYVLYEASFLNTMEENLNYPSVDRLRQVFGTKIPSETAQSYIHNPEALANLVYGGTLGNNQPGDGYRYRGRGYILIIGRDNYVSTSEALGLDSQLETDPDRLTRDHKLAARAAAFTYARLTGPLRAGGTPIQFVDGWRRLSGGLNGLSPGKAIYDRIVSAS